MTLEARKEYEIEMKELVSNCNSIQNDGYSTEIPIQQYLHYRQTGPLELGGQVGWQRRVVQKTRRRRVWLLAI